MNRTLFAGDLHAKGDLLPFISNMADREHADRIVLLGDICDDWHVSNTGMIRFMERFASWYRAESGRREIVPLLGNHDVPYLMQHGSASFARVRAQAPGFKPGAQRRVHELMKDIPIRIAWTDGTIIATHAGLTRRFGHAWTGMTADRIAARLNRLPDRPGSLAALYMDDDGVFSQVGVSCFVTNFFRFGAGAVLLDSSLIPSPPIMPQDRARVDDP